MRTLVAAAALVILTAQDPLATGSFSGRVLDADTLSPVAGVSVGSQEIGYVLTDSEGMIEGLTNEDGAFQTRSLRPGQYIVLATNDPPSFVVLGPDGGISIQRSPEAMARILRARGRGQFIEVGPRATIHVNLTPRTLD